MNDTCMSLQLLKVVTFFVQCIPTLSGSSNRTLQSHSETNLGFTTVVDVSLVQEERTESRQSFEEGQEMKEVSLKNKCANVNFKVIMVFLYFFI